MDREKLTSRKAELIKTIEAIDEVIRSKGWQVLRGEFEGLADIKERLLLQEAKKSVIDVDTIHVLQGELAAIKRYDLATHSEKLKKELEGIKLNLQ